MSTESVFISYSSKDAEFASNLANSLTNAGASVWIESINGENDEDVTAAAIKSAKLFLIVTSNNALDDESLKQEKDFARENKIDRLLIKIEACDTESKMRWQGLQCIDYTSNREAGLQTILDKLRIKTAIEEVNPSPKREVVKKSSDDEVIKKAETPATPTVEETSVIENEDLLNELNEGFDYYRFKMNNQIRYSYYGLGALIAASFILLIGLYFWDGLQEFMEEGQEKLKYLGTVGGIIPSTLGTFSVSKIKEKKKRRDGIEDFERTLSRMKKGLVPNSKQHILDLEDEFIKYTKY